jgi:CHASE2 domain-containing sensor protein
MPGAMVHANFVEAILNSRAVGGTSSLVPELIEWLILVVAIMLFATSVNAFVQLITLVGITLVLLVIEWAALHHFSLFFDMAVPLAAVWLHAGIDRLGAPSDTE